MKNHMKVSRIKGLGNSNHGLSLTQQNIDSCAGIIVSQTWPCELSKSTKNGETWCSAKTIYEVDE